MKYSRLLALSTTAVALAGCTHLTRNTNQFYRAQTYLPLAMPEVGNVTSHEARCAAGPVVDLPRDPPERQATKPLSGMTLQVIETSYSSTRDDATPILSEWRWTIPAPSEVPPCALSGTMVPRWQRNDLIKVRHLLSRAQHSQEPKDTGTEYFALAMARACPGGNGIPGCFEKLFLDKFVAGLQINLRGQLDELGSGTKVGRFDPSTPSDVLAGADASQVTTTAGLARWYNALTAPRDADLFGRSEQAAVCASAFRDVGGAVAQDAEVCRFSQASLEWRAESAAQALPGRILEPLRKLLLLRSGDPLLLMQPAAYRMPLDTSEAQSCGADKACPLAKRMAQGFVQFEVLIPISLEGNTQEWVSVGASIADFERRRGVTVKEVRRSTNWLPLDVAVEDEGKSKAVPVGALTSDAGRMTLRFGQARGWGRGVTVVPHDGRDSAKEDMLFAPGDIVVLDMAN